jgi:spermidine synthase
MIAVHSTMDEQDPNRYLPLLLALFIGSGCAALIYEIVWFQLLQLIIGSSAISLGVLLGTFMGGMCLGSVTLPRVVSARRHPLRVYALIELGIAMLGVLVLFSMPQIDRLYAATAVQGGAGILLRAVVCVICLLPSTLLMGASLPAIARWVEANPNGISWLGFFYGGNIAGAVFGCLWAGFYLLRVHDIPTATYAAVAINIAVALVSLGLAARTPHMKLEVAAGGNHRLAPRSWPVYLAIAISGMAALGAEVTWTRLLSLMLGATVYTFSIILAVFLAGLGLGSSFGSFLARATARPRIAFGVCQIFLSGAIAWTAYMLANSLPFWPIDTSIATSPWFVFQLDLARCLWALLPAACLWGASFPLALAAAASSGQDTGRLVGGLYAANTIGAIAGATVFSMLLIPSLGTQNSQRALIALSTVSALIVLAPILRPFRARIAGGIGLLAGVILSALLAWSVSRVPWGVFAYGRHLPTTVATSQLLYLGEGINSSVVVSLLDDGAKFFHVSGKVEASTEPHDMRLQRMLGHISALLHSKPRCVLVVGCGAGVTAGAFVLHPDVNKILICEIEPLVPPAVARFFAKENYNVLTDRRVRVVYDDARHFVLTTPEKFDIITSDPIHPWVKGAATLYSKEYFELCKRHLNSGGVITQWVPLYESNLETVQSEIATFFQVFPSGTVWSNDIDGMGYDVVLLGQKDPTSINVDALQERLDRPDHSKVAASLREVGFASAVDLLGTYAGRQRDLAGWLWKAEINRDRNLRLQYLAGMGLNLYRGRAIYDEMLRYRKFPKDLFAASYDRELALRYRLGKMPAGE